MMTDYYEINDAIPHAIWHRKPGDSDWDTLDDMRVESIRNSFPRLTLQCIRREHVPDYFKSGRKPIVSTEFRKLAERFDVAAEFLPVTMLDHQGNDAKGGPYWFMHMLEDIDCIDFERSEIEAISERPDSVLWEVRRLLFRPEAIGMQAIFRPRRYLQIFVSTAVRDEIIRARLKTLLTPLSEVRM